MFSLLALADNRILYLRQLGARKKSPYEESLLFDEADIIYFIEVDAKHAAREFIFMIKKLNLH